MPGARLPNRRAAARPGARLRKNLRQPARRGTGRLQRRGGIAGTGVQRSPGVRSRLSLQISDRNLPARRLAGRRQPGPLRHDRAGHQHGQPLRRTIALLALSNQRRRPPAAGGLQASGHPNGRRAPRLVDQQPKHPGVRRSAFRRGMAGIPLPAGRLEARLIQPGQPTPGQALYDTGGGHGPGQRHGHRCTTLGQRGRVRQLHRRGTGRRLLRPHQRPLDEIRQQRPAPAPVLYRLDHRPAPAGDGHRRCRPKILVPSQIQIDYNVGGASENPLAIGVESAAKCAGWRAKSPAGNRPNGYRKSAW